MKASNPKNIAQTPTEAEYIQYTPAPKADGSSAGQSRIIKLVEKPVDPMEPARFKHKRIPAGKSSISRYLGIYLSISIFLMLTCHLPNVAPPSPPPPVMHSPPRKVTVEEQREWKIPPSISNWKNPKGYVIPLDKRLAADGRGLQEVSFGTDRVCVMVH